MHQARTTPSQFLGFETTPDETRRAGRSRRHAGVLSFTNTYLNSRADLGKGADFCDAFYGGTAPSHNPSVIRCGVQESQVKAAPTRATNRLIFLGEPILL